MKSVLFVSMLSKSQAGGSELLWTQTAVELVRRGARVTANVRDDDGPMAEHLSFLQRQGVDVCVRESLGRESFWMRAIKRIWRRVSGKRPDPFGWIRENRPCLAVITQTGNMDGIDVMEACGRFAVPYVSIAHSASFAVWPPDDYLGRLKSVLNGALKCFFVSKANLELTQMQLGGVLLENAGLVRNPFNVSYDAKPQWPDENVFRLLCLGRIEPFAKGQDLLFQVMNMKKWRDRPVEAACVGKGFNEKTVRELIASLNLTNVRLLPFDENVEQLWAGFHALVLPSRYEGLPVVIVEAMLCGRICIVTDTAGNKELLEEGETGFIAAAPTVELLDQAMERAWQRRHEWRRMGERAAQAVRNVIPRNPANVFCDTLIQLMEERKLRSSDMS